MAGNWPADSVSKWSTFAAPPVAPVQLLVSVIEVLGEILEIVEFNVVTPSVTVTLSPTARGLVLVIVTTFEPNVTPALVK